MSYQMALETCDREIFYLWGSINDFLPDANGEYLEEWTMSDCEYIQKRFKETADVILGTELADHCTCELTTALDAYDKVVDAAKKTADVSRCKVAAIHCVDVFHEIRMVCQRARRVIAARGALIPA